MSIYCEKILRITVTIIFDSWSQHFIQAILEWRYLVDKNWLYSRTCWHNLILEFSCTGFPWNFFFFFFFFLYQLVSGWNLLQFPVQYIWEAIRKLWELVCCAWGPLAICLLFSESTYIFVMSSFLLLLFVFIVMSIWFFVIALCSPLVDTSSVWGAPQHFGHYNSVLAVNFDWAEPEGHSEVKS